MDTITTGTAAGRSAAHDAERPAYRLDQDDLRRLLEAADAYAAALADTATAQAAPKLVLPLRRVGRP